LIPLIEDHRKAREKAQKKVLGPLRMLETVSLEPHAREPHVDRNPFRAPVSNRDLLSRTKRGFGFALCQARDRGRVEACRRLPVEIGWSRGTRHTRTRGSGSRRGR
jgi:hypothetical protein